MLKLSGGLVLAMLCGADAARAQIVNVQAALADEPPQGISGGIDGSLDWRTGNTDLLRVAGAATIRLRHGPGIGLLVLKGEYGKAGDPAQLFLAKTFGHLRYRYAFTSWLQGESFVQHETDEFRRLASRALAGIGPRFVLFQGKTASLAAGVAYMLERSRLSDDGEAGAGGATWEHRTSSYLVGSVAANEQVRFHGSVYLQPRLDEPGDVRALAELGFAVSLTKRFALTTQFILSYDARPPPETEELDTALVTGFSITL